MKGGNLNWGWIIFWVWMLGGFGDCDRVASVNKAPEPAPTIVEEPATPGDFKVEG